MTNFRDASTVWYIAAAGRATPATSAAALSAPADEPKTMSKQRVSPSRSSAAVMPAETTPRMPPPSSTTAIAVGVAARARSRALAQARVQEVGDGVVGDGGRHGL